MEIQEGRGYEGRGKVHLHKCDYYSGGGKIRLHNYDYYSSRPAFIYNKRRRK